MGYNPTPMVTAARLQRMNGSLSGLLAHRALSGRSGIAGKPIDRRSYGHQAAHFRSRKRSKKYKPVRWEAPPVMDAIEVTDLATDGGRATCTLMQLTSDTCRWPYEGGLFCGADPEAGLPYCSTHCKRAYYDFDPGRRRTSEL